MEFRHATQDDIGDVAETTISQGIKDVPECIDLVYCLEHEGKKLAVGGVKLLVPGTAIAWFSYSQHAKDHIITVYRTTKEWLAKLMEIHSLTRVMAFVRADFPAAIRTAMHLGFELETTMPRFFGEDAAMVFVKFAEKKNG